VATAASTALPPAFSIASPASLASPFAEVTTPCFATTRLLSSAGDAGEIAAGVAGSPTPVVDTVAVVNRAATATVIPSTQAVKTGAGTNTGERRIICGMTVGSSEIELCRG
jgi:hypothetical protein